MSNAKVYKILDWGAYIFLLATVVIVPLFLDKNLVNFYIIPKQYVFIGLTAVAFLLYAAKVVLSKRFEFRKSVIDWLLLGLLAVALLSSIFSVNSLDSFLGRSEYFVLNFLFLFFLCLNFLLNINFLNTTQRWRVMLDTLIGVGGVTALVFVLKSIFKFDLLALVGLPIWNSIDRLNSHFGLWLIVVGLLAAGLLLKKNLTAGKSLFYFLVFILSFVALVLLSFSVLWWILLAGLILLLLVAVSFVKEARMGWISVLFATLVLVVIFISFGAPRSLQSSIPTEVALGFKPSWAITFDNLTSGVKRFFIGSGLGTFGVDFSRFRPNDFNYDSNAWSLRFNQPNNTFTAVLAEGGTVMFLLMLFLVAFVLGHIFQAWYKKAREMSFGFASLNSQADDKGVSLETMLVAVVWLVLCGAMAVMFFGPVLWWFWWLLLGLIVTGLALSHDHIVKFKVWEVEDTPQYSLSFSFTLIVIIAAVIMVGVWGAKMYYAEVNYAQALQAQDLKVAEQKIGVALNQRSNSDTYNVALAQVYLLQAAELAKTGKDLQSVSTLVANAVNIAKRATDVSPQSVAIWENLVTMYENAAAIIPDARAWAIKSVIQARDLDPTNPVLWWRLGNNYGLDGQWEEAIKSYEQAIKLKSDYLNSYISLANAYEQKRDIEKAVEAYKTIMPYAMDNSEALFNFGRLLYNRNKTTDRSDAEKLWLESVRIQPSYSNALYSLGLLYESKGDRARALEYYYKVKDLNPGNKDIASKISGMVGGVSAP
ncbi:MAG: tetratricopeptide repeat protein [Candidatus Magasanikbacteria bacterium]